MHAHPEQIVIPSHPSFGGRRSLRSGSLSCLYENGFIRYISFAGQEVARSVYPAVRNENWETPPGRITEETIDSDRNGFRVTYKVVYTLREIVYTAKVDIACIDGHTLKYDFSGVAESDFRRNRLGLCLLLPPEPLKNRSFTVTRPDGTKQTGRFPVLVSPEPVMKNVTALRWETASGLVTEGIFTGDVFEAEDQRNYGDASYKIYSTPQALPKPVVVRTGETVQQSVSLTISGPETMMAVAGPGVVAFQTGGAAYPFPTIGYSRNSAGEPLDAETIRLLRRLPFHHYRVELLLQGDSWRSTLAGALAEARLLQADVLVVAFFPSANARETAVALGEEMVKYAGQVGQVLLLDDHAGYGPPAAYEEIVALLRSKTPGVRFGTGSDTYFATWNENFVPSAASALTTFPLHPQVHLNDDLTVIENLSAQADIVETARQKAGTLPLFVGPVTIGPRYNPDVPLAPGSSAHGVAYRTDERQATLLAAAWTTLSIRYLGRAGNISYHETTGPRGLVPATSAAPGVATTRIFPVYLPLREIAAFHPERFLQSRSAQPLLLDGLVMENKKGERLMVFANFSRSIQTLQLKTETWKVRTLFGKRILPGMLPDLLEDGDKFRSTPYEPFALTEGNLCRLPAGSLLFLTTLQDWSFG